jgi:hypothetical protein
VNCTLQGQLRKKVTAKKDIRLFSLKIWGKFPQIIANLVKFTLEKKKLPCFCHKKKEGAKFGANKFGK